MYQNAINKNTKKNRWIGWIVVCIGLFLMARTGMNLVKLWKAGDQVTEAQKELAILQKENLKLQDRLKEVQTPEFVEREAREKLGYGKPGEVVVYVPNQVQDQAKAAVAAEEPNWKKWKKLYMGI